MSSNRMENEALIDHAYKIYSLIVEDRIKEVTSKDSYVS